MSNYPYVDSGQVIDTIEEKPFELIHQRYFNNISIATGWKESNDGLYNYYKDILLPIGEGEAPITLSYSPEVIIPANANPNNRPSNFPYSKTVALNTVRLYSFRVPDEADALPVTVLMRNSGTSEGITNGVYEPEDSVLNTQRISFQAKGSSFFISLDEDRYTTEESTLTVTVSAFRGTERIIPFIENKKENLLYNLDGTNIDIPEAVITDVMLDKEKPVKSVTIKIPKGTLIKDRQAYILIGVSSSAGTTYTHTIRSVIYTNFSEKNVSTLSIYDVEMPTFTRTGGGVYSANGVTIGQTGYNIKITSTTLNGQTSAAVGTLKLIEKDSGTDRVIASVVVAAGVANIIPSTVFAGVDEFDYEFYVGGQQVHINSSKIVESGETITVKIDPKYVIPTIENGKFIIPEIRVSAFIIAASGSFIPFYGNFIVKDNDTDEYLTTNTPQPTLVIPRRELEQNELPSNYSVEVYDPTSYVAARGKAFLSIAKEGDLVLPYTLDLAPSSLIVPTSSNDELEEEMSFEAIVKKGNIDATADWNFSVATPQGTLDNYLMVIEQKNNKFTLKRFQGNQQSVVIKIKATNKIDPTLVYEKELVIAKLRAVEDMGNYTFVKYGEYDSNGDIIFTIDPDEVLPPGAVKGPLYGVAISKTPEVPSVTEFEWIDTSSRDGKTFYTWIRYADSANGSGISGSSVGKKYIGFAYNKEEETPSNKASDYEWTLIQGEDGISIIGVDEYYQTTDSLTPPPLGNDWIKNPETVPSTSVNKRYLWNYEVIIRSGEDNNIPTKRRVIGTHGATGSKGEEGNGIVEVIDYYFANNSPTTPPSDSEFGTNVVVPTESKRFLWNYEKIIYSNGSVEKTLKRVIGVYGEKGDDGTSPYSIHIFSTNGNVFKNNQLSTTLFIKVFRGDVDITSSVNANNCKWTRSSTNAASDTAWNNQNKKGKEILLTEADVWQRATFSCEVTI